jgi:protein-L-isoaspartate(D-aspartate) O-methyltransferase
LHGDGSMGWKPNAPYDGIVVSAASPGVPRPLVEQLTPGGRMVIPVGAEDRQVLTLVCRDDSEAGYSETAISDVRFVPLLGEFGHTPPES